MRKNEILTALFIAKKNILKNRKSLFLTIFIISLGFISSIIIWGVLQDTGHDMQENYIETNMGHVILESYEENEKIENELREKIDYLISGIPNIQLSDVPVGDGTKNKEIHEHGKIPKIKNPNPVLV